MSSVTVSIAGIVERGSVLVVDGSQFDEDPAGIEARLREMSRAVYAVCGHADFVIVVLEAGETLALLTPAALAEQPGWDRVTLWGSECVDCGNATHASQRCDTCGREQATVPLYAVDVKPGSVMLDGGYPADDGIIHLLGAG